MIAYLKGTVLFFEESTVVVDVGGVGYEVLLPTIEAKALRTRLHREGDALHPEGQAVELWTYYHVAERQPRPLLIGFQERQNRAFFQLLLSVPEVGPTIAARSMVIPVCDYAGAIERRDSRTLGTLPGIGKRKAEQIVAALKGKALSFALLPAPEISEIPEVSESFISDIEEILVHSLGYRPAEAVRMIEAARKRKPELNEAQALLEEIWAGEKPS
jgi:Holliday junction DNA helicase RuvA